MKYLKGRYEDSSFYPDVVVINCGLHDCNRIPKTNAIAVEETEYDDNFAAILAPVRAMGAELVWINTTPVNDVRHNSLSKELHRQNADVKRYNEIAAEPLTRHARTERTDHRAGKTDEPSEAKHRRRQMKTSVNCRVVPAMTALSKPKSDPASAPTAIAFEISVQTILEIGRLDGMRRCCKSVI